MAFGRTSRAQCALPRSASAMLAWPFCFRKAARTRHEQGRDGPHRGRSLCTTRSARTALLERRRLRIRHGVQAQGVPATEGCVGTGAKRSTSQHARIKTAQMMSHEAALSSCPLYRGWCQCIRREAVRLKTELSFTPVACIPGAIHEAVGRSHVDDRSGARRAIEPLDVAYARCPVPTLLGERLHAIRRVSADILCCLAEAMKELAGDELLSGRVPRTPMPCTTANRARPRPPPPRPPRGGGGGGWLVARVAMPSLATARRAGWKSGRRMSCGPLRLH